MLFGFAALTPATAQPLFRISPAIIDGRKFEFQSMEPAKCLEPVSVYAKAFDANTCPANYDCAASKRFLVGTPSETLASDDQRRFYVYDSERRSLSCWAGTFKYESSTGFPGIGTAAVTVSDGAATETAQLPVYGPAKADLVVPTPCSNLTLTVGSSANCTVTVSWKHPSKSGKLSACQWTAPGSLLSEGTPNTDFPCLGKSAQAAPKPIDLFLNRDVEITVPLAVGWDRWKQALQSPFQSQEHTVSVRLRYRFTDGGPEFETPAPVKFQVAFPMMGLLLCVVAGLLTGSALTLVARYVRKQSPGLPAWRRNAVGIAIYGTVFWAVLYHLGGAFGLSGRQYRMDQAVPVLLFGMILGFRGFEFVSEQLGQLFNKAQAGPTQSGIILIGILLIPNLYGQSASTPTRHLLTIANGQVLLITDQGAAPVDTPARRLISFAPGATAGPAAARIGPNPRIWVTLRLPGGKVLLDEYLPNGKRADKLIIDLSDAPFRFTAPPDGIAWDEQRQRLLLASAGGELFQISASHPTGLRIGNVPGLIRAIAVDSANQRLFAADGRNARVFLLELKETSASAPMAFANDKVLADPRALAYDTGAQTLYVADEHRDAVFYLKAVPPARPLNTSWREFVSDKYKYLKQFNFGDPVAIAIANGRLWIGDSNARNIFPVDLMTREQLRPMRLP